MKIMKKYLSLLVFLFFASAGSVPAAEVYIDLGTSDIDADDFNNPNLHIGDYWMPMDRHKETSTQWFPYQDYALLPNPSQFITMRKIHGQNLPGLFFANAGVFQTANNQNQTPLYVTLRYKDVNLSPSYDKYHSAGKGDGAGVYTCNAADVGGGSNITRLGTLGGTRDFQWKTKTLLVPAQTIPVVNNQFIFKIGHSAYSGGDIYGDFYVDWIRVSDVDPRPAGVGFNENYNVLPGLNPTRTINPDFTNFAQTGIIHEGQPFFPIGLYTISRHFYWADQNHNYMQNARDTGFNTIIYNGWEADGSGGGWFWGEKDTVGQADYGLSGHPTMIYPARYLGLPNFLNEAAKYNLMVIPWFTTDMCYYWIYNSGRTYFPDYGGASSPYNGTFPGVINAFRMVVQNNKNHPQVLMWHIKDEADMPNPWWGSTYESVAQIYDAVTQEDGRHPCWVNCMGWRSQSFRYYKDAFDVGSYDRYTHAFDGQTCHQNLGEWPEEFKYETNNEKPYMAVIQSESSEVYNGVWTSITDARIGTYLSLIHGAQGILFFYDPGPNVASPTYDHCGNDCGPNYWALWKNLLDEVNALAYTALHHSNADTIGYTWGTSRNRDIFPLDHTTWGEGGTSHTNIHAVMRENRQTHDRYLITVNAFGETISPVFNVSWLKAGDQVEVLFEGRFITAQNGSFSDTFSGGQNHTYIFRSGNHFTISGSVTHNGNGLSGVVLSGLPGNPTTNASGEYTASVSEGWGGTVTPARNGYTFNPANRTYNNVTADQSGQNYTAAALPTYTIAGTITQNGNALAGVVLSGLPGSPTTNASGQYTATVNQGFSGTATPVLAGYTFNPANRAYNNVTSDQNGQDYTAAALPTYTIAGTVTQNGNALAGVVLSGLPGSPTTNASGQYTATVNQGFSGIATPVLAGYTFNPANRTYNNVTTNQTNQNYTASASGSGGDSSAGGEGGGGGGGGCFIGAAPGGFPQRILGWFFH